MRIVLVRIIPLLIALSITSTGARALEVENESKHELSAHDITTILQMAREQGPWEVEQIHAGELVHPLGPWGVFINFKPEVIETYSIQRSLPLVNLTWPNATDWVPDASRTLASGNWVPLDQGVHSSIRRLFKVGDDTLKLRIDDSLSYYQANDYIQRLAKNDFEVRDASLSTEIEIQKAWAMEYDPDIKELTVSVGSGKKYSWYEFAFLIEETRLILIEVRHCMA